jgi:pantoate--beta-alanine ligase
MPTPRIVRDPAELFARCEEARRRGQAPAVGFVPTMGALHAGHLSLVSAARGRASLVVVSVFVNPTQFGPTEDLALYPRDLQGDVAKLAPAGVDVVFAPEAAAIYPPGEQTRVRVGAVAEPLCGSRRPGHFEGVATVVAKLLNLVGPCVAFFGKKDFQQLLVIRRMARDLFVPAQIEGCPIVREPDGLAMSSRNTYLSAEERTRALALVRGIDAAARLFARGERRARELERVARAPIAAAATSVEYVEVRDADSLEAIEGNMAERAVLAVACFVGKTRLIDNVVLGEDPPPLSPLA